MAAKPKDYFAKRLENRAAMKKAKRKPAPSRKTK
jgi:hypothetical protein